MITSSIQFFNTSESCWTSLTALCEYFWSLNGFSCPYCVFRRYFLRFRSGTWNVCLQDSWRKDSDGWMQACNFDCAGEVAAFAMVSGILCVALPTTILAVEFADKYQVLWLSQSARPVLCQNRTYCNLRFVVNKIEYSNIMGRLSCIQLDPWSIHEHVLIFYDFGSSHTRRGSPDNLMTVESFFGFPRMYLM